MYFNVISSALQGLSNRYPWKKICLKPFQLRKLCYGFHAFAACMDGIALGKFNNIADQTVMIDAALNFSHEAAADFDLIHVQLFQIAQIGVTSAEIVDGKADTINRRFFRPMTDRYVCGKSQDVL